MYFFLSHLALTDISFSSVTAPKMLKNMLTDSQSISYAGCVSQVYFFIFFADLDSFLLTSMAYDRYVAICHPLHYTTIMSQSLCVLLVVVSWVLSFASALLHTLLLARLSFCGNNTLPHFFCNLSALLKLSSSDITINELVIFTVGVVTITVPLICILVSYGHIGATILRTPSIKGICKALSTCGSHLCSEESGYERSREKPSHQEKREKMSCIRRNNQSITSGFILLGLPIQPEDQGMYSALFLATYLTTVLGNLLIVLLIKLKNLWR
ncbi:hypothetical protein A6R68_05643 [Neotoma lepida]|uniref:Olfactory receptor n=1 Tax=Neotoma lepida TaxID=56216 RepID=A0A1A6GKG0_NEOLE|nr:hypothetical protein A6R68_05643 [Neotoma lepida]